MMMMMMMMMIIMVVMVMVMVMMMMIKTLSVVKLPAVIHHYLGLSKILIKINLQLKNEI